MADQDTSEEFGQVPSSWTDDRVEQLKVMWERGLTASQIADELGGVSRNAVIGKAHGLGLQSRPSPVQANEVTQKALNPSQFEAILESESSAKVAEDPIKKLVGGSVRLQPLLDWTWPGGSPYLDRQASHILRASSLLATARAKAGDEPLVTMVDVVEILMTWVISPKARKELPGLKRWIEESLPPAGPRMSVLGLDGKTLSPNHSILRWDVVEMMAGATELRHRYEQQYPALTPALMLAATVQFHGGQAALKQAGYLAEGFEALIRIVTQDWYRIGRNLKSARRVLPHLADCISTQPYLLERDYAPNEYSSDKIERDLDALGTSSDANSLAELIMLEAAEPPLAIGVFGPWGSGKSTLLGQIQHRASAIAREEQELMASGASGNSATRRVSNILQVELNAWTFADSGNLWASITSEIFDQITAGGIDGSARDHGTRLIAEVGTTTAKMVSNLRMAQSEIDDFEAQVAGAKADLRRAKDEKKSALAAALSDAIADLVGPVDDSKNNEGKKEAETRSALQALREGLTEEGQKSSATTMLRYLAATRDITRLIFLIGYFLRRHYKMALTVCVCLFAVYFFVWRGWDQLQKLSSYLPGGQWFVASVPCLVACGWGWKTIVAPSFRAIGKYRSRLEERREVAVKGIEKAAAALKSAEAGKANAEKQKKSAEDYIARHNIGSEAAGSPAAMLEYLLKDSVDVAAVQAQLGFIAVVRRRFEQLNAVIRRNRTAQSPGGPERIIIYIDDLDRCSEKQVVGILQAIHLLLAFDCFVVVAAVDAQWLRRSLQIELSQFAESDDGSARVATADYLEKIFQIPYWVRQIDGQDEQGERYEAYRRYIRFLLRASGNTPVESNGETDELAADEARSDSGAALERIEPLAPNEPEPELRPLRITPEEMAMIVELGPLAAKSPRAVKRMINLYRLLRASLSVEELDSFLRRGAGNVPAYQLVQLILACEVGMPSDAMNACDEAISAMEDEDYWQFTTAIDSPTIARDYNSPLRTALMDVGKWSAFVAASRMVSEKLGGTPRLQDLKAACLLVRRYSFRAP